MKKSYYSFSITFIRKLKYGKGCQEISDLYLEKTT
jgi:hypothetical protein